MFRTGRAGNLRRSGSSRECFEGMTDCGRTLRQSQPAGPHGSCYIWGVGVGLESDQPAGRGPICPGESNVFIQRPVSMGPIHHPYDHQDLLLAGDRTDLPVRPFRNLLRSRRRWRSARSAASWCCCHRSPSVVVGIVFSRIAAELILIVFRINEHLGAIRDQGGGRGEAASAVGCAKAQSAVPTILSRFERRGGHRFRLRSSSYGGQVALPPYSTALSRLTY